MSSKERREWVLANKDKGVTIRCDNDATYLTFEDEAVTIVNCAVYLNNHQR